MSEPAAANPLIALSRRLGELIPPAATRVVAVQAHGRTLASGFIWKPGVAVTASDPLEADDEIAVTIADGRTVAAELAGRDPATDIAVLRIPDGPPDLHAPAASGEAQIGQLVVAIGRHNQDPIASLGMVSVAGGRWQSLRGGTIDSLIRLDIRLDPRCEGGLIIDAEGRAVGMPVFGPRRRTVVIPMATIERVGGQLLAEGRVRRGYLGLGLHPVRLDAALPESHALPEGRGLVVVSVDPQGPARAAGILVGDVIARLDGEAVPSVRSLFRRLSPESVGRTAECGIVRAGQPMTLKLAIGASPSP